MNQDQARRWAEEVLSDTEIDRCSPCGLDQWHLTFAKDVIAAALVKFTQGQEPVIPTVQQILNACEEAGLWPNTAPAWVQNGAFRRYHEAINRMLHTNPAPSQQAALPQLTSGV